MTKKVIREQIKKLAVKYEPDCNVKYYETGEELLAEGKKSLMCYSLIFRWRA